MNRQSRIFYLLTAALATFLLASCDVRDRFETRLERRWPATGVQRVSIREVDGSVQIDASPTDEISLVAHVVARGMRPEVKAENLGFFRSSVDGDTLRIGSLKQHHGIRVPFLFRRNNVTVDYVLRVPATVALDISTVNGRIATRGVNGETDVTTVNGPIDISASGENLLAARTVNGPVRATFGRTFQGASLKTVNGGVSAVLPPSASFACELSQVNGDFEANFPLSIHSQPGSRRVSGDVNGGRFELKITTVNGDIHIENVIPPPPAPTAPQAPAAPGSIPAPPAPTAPSAPDRT